MSQWLLVFLGGGLGSLARFSISKLTALYWKNPFPLATLLSNMLATALLGILAYIVISRQEINPWIKSFLMIGFCGGFSTFSTFSVETFQLMKEGLFFVALANILVSVSVCVGIVYLVVKFSN